jgi:hypothetical protein
LSFPAGAHDDQVDAVGLIGVSLPGAETMAQFISADSVWRAMDPRSEYETAVYDPLVLAVSVARFRGEPTVLCLRRGRDARSVPTVKAFDLDAMAIAGRIGGLSERYKPETIFVALDGPGTGVIDRCNYLRLLVRGVDLGGKPDGDMETVNSSGVRYFDRRSEMYGRLRDWIGAGAMLGDDQDLANELTAIQYDYARRDGVDGLVVEGREELQRRGLPPANAADALAMTFAFWVGRADQLWKLGRGARHESEYDPLPYPGVGGVGSAVGPSRAETPVNDDIFGAFRGRSRW